MNMATPDNRGQAGNRPGGAAAALPARRWFASLCSVLCLLSLLALGLAAAPAHAQRAFTARYNGNINGDVKLIGNTLSTCIDASNGTAAGVCNAAKLGNDSGNIDNLNNNQYNSIAIDIDGDPTTFNSSSSLLNTPPSGTILFAGLYWGGKSASALRGQVLFKGPGSGGYSTVNASQVDAAGAGYAAFSDVTNYVRTNGIGDYTVANVQSTYGGTDQWTGWGLVVVYNDNTQPLRNVVVYDGFVNITNATGITLTPSGFLTPLSGPVNTRVGSIGYDGDRGLIGDNFAVNNVNLIDALNVTDNYFNSSLSDNGALATTNTPSIANQFGFDVDRSNVPAGVIANGASSASLHLFTGGEAYYPQVITFSTDIYVPIITPNVTKTATDLNGGYLLPGDTIRWTISMSNTGLDAGTNLVLTDPIPQYTTYVPGSLRIISGANAGVKTDATDADQAEKTGALNSANPVVFRLGTGATNTAGGTLAYGQSTSISFDTIVGAVSAGTQITNTASLTYSGQTLSNTSFSTSSSAVAANVLGPPTIAKSFNPTVIAATPATSQLRIVVSNPAANPVALTGVVVADTYPAGLVNAAVPNAQINCTAGATPGTLTGGTAGGNTIGMNPGASIPPNGSCTITVNVSAPAGNYVNTTSPVSTTNGGVGGTASATLSVGKIAIAKAFAVPSVYTNTDTQMTITVTNSTGGAVTGVAFTDTYPAGLINATPSGVAAVGCGAPVLTAAAGGTALSMTGGSLGAGASCTITVNVRSATGGVYNNTTSGATHSTDAVPGNPSNTATLTVVGAPTITKSFSPVSIPRGGVSTLQIVIANPNTTTTVTRTGGGGVVFTDAYPSNPTPRTLNNTNPRSITINCSTGSSVSLATGTGTAGGADIGLSNLTLLPGGTCTLTSAVTHSGTATAGADGAYNNTIPVGSVTYDNAPSAASNSATLTVTNTPIPNPVKAFTPATIGVGGTSNMTITITAPAAASPLTGVAFFDGYPGNLVNTGALLTSTGCGAPVLTAPAGGTSLSMSGGTVTNGTPCVVTVQVTGSAAGSIINAVGPITANNASPSAIVNGTLQVVAPPTITKSFGTNPVATATNSLLTITLTNPASNPVNLTGVAFTDTYPGTLRNNTGGAVTSNTCGGTPAVSGNGVIPGTLGITGVTLTPGATCTLTVQTQSAAGGTFVNTTGAVTSTQSGAGGTATATLTVGKLGIAKAFAPATIPSGGTSTLTFTIGNSAGVAATGIAFTDTLTNMQLLNGAVGGTCTGVVSNAAAGVTSLAVTSGNVPTPGGCTITFQVTSSNPGVQPNTSSGVTRAGDPVAGAPSNTATLTVTPTPSVTKSFTPASAGVYVSPAAQVLGTNMTRLTITILNPNTTAATGANFTDTYPPNMVNAAVPNVSNTCGGTVTAAAGANTVSLAAGVLPLNSTCSVSVNVVSTVAGSYTNTIPAGGLTSSLGPNANPATADVQILRPPTVTKTFFPGSIPTGGTAQLMITLTNPNPTAITGAAFTDTYPAGLVNAAVPNPVTSCAGGTASAPATNQLAVTGASIPGGGSCNVTVNVTSAAAGAYLNTLAAGAVTTTNTGPNTTAASDTLLVGRVRIDKAFSPNPIAAGGLSTLTFTLTNPGTPALSAVAFTDTFPNTPGAMVVAGTPAATNTCGGVFTAGAGATSVSLTGGAIPVGSTCTLSVQVTAPVSGNYNNVTGTVSANTGAGNTAAATLTVMAGPTVAKLFAPSVVGINQVSQLTITVTNPNSFAITGAGFTDTYPATLVNSATPAGATTCSGGSVTAANGGGSLALSGATIPAGGACTVTVNVIGTTAGTKTNTLAVGAVTSTNAPPSVGPATNAVLTVLSPPTVTKAFAASPLATTATTTTLTITLTNPNTTPITGAGFTDNYPTNLVNAAAANPLTTCGSGTVLAANNGSSVGLVGGVIPASGSCTVTVVVRGTLPGTYFNNTGPVATTNAGTGTGATATLAVNAPLVVTKAFADGQIAQNGSTTLTITITNPNPVAITGATFTDLFPTNSLDIIAGTLVDTDCTLAPTVNTADPDSLTFTNKTIPANTSCRVTVTVQANNTTFTVNNCIPAFTPANAGQTPQACAILQVGTSNTTPPNISKAFAPASIGAGGVSQLTFTIVNNASASATAVAFTDTYPAGLVNASPPNVVGNCGGGTVTAAAGAGSLTLAGGAIAGTNGAQCTIQVDVTAATSGIYNNTSGTVSATINAGTRTGNTASAALTVATPVSIAKAFAPSIINAGGTSTITFTLTNPNPAAVTASFTDALNGMQAVGGAAGGTCGGANTNNVTAGATSLSITGLTVLANGASCTVTVPVTSSTPGVLPNATSGVTANGTTGSPSNTANLTVNAGAPSITKSFTPATIAAGGSTTMTFTVTNPNGTALTGLSFTDGMTNMSLAPVPSVGGTCAGLTTSATGGATSFTVTGGTIPPNASCTVTVLVTSNTVGVWPNISSGVTTNETPTAGSQSNTANLTVLASGAPVSGIVFNDLNANGTLDNAESWAAGTPVFVNLVSGGVVVQSVAVPVGTGAYSFANVPVGNYTIVVTNSNINTAAVVPATWAFTGPTDGTIATSVGTTGLPGQNFGLRQGQRISGRVFRDTGAAPLGTTPNNGILDTNEAPANPQNPALQPVGYAGVTVNLYTNANCTGAPAATTSTDGSGNYVFPSAAAGGALCIQKMAPTGSIATGASNGNTALPSGTPTGGFTYCRGPALCGAQLADTISFTAAANTTYANLNFGVVPANTFVADQTQQGPPGTTLNYAHTYVAGTVGSVTFTSAAVARPAIAGWSEVIYRDLNCNGTLDAGETVLTGAVAVNPNDTAAGEPSARRVCLIMREFIPPSAPAGAENRATISAAFTYTNANPALASTLTVVDTTLSGSATGGDGLRLRKEVCNITQQLLLASPCNAALTGAGAGNGFADTNVGKSGDELIYRIVYSNASSNNLSTIVISDSAPPYTVRATTAAAYATTPTGLTNGTITQPASGQAGAFNWTFTGNLAPNLQGVVTFNVVIQ